MTIYVNTHDLVVLLKSERFINREYTVVSSQPSPWFAGEYQDEEDGRTLRVWVVLGD